MRKFLFVLAAAVAVSISIAGPAGADADRHRNSGSCSGEVMAWGRFHAYTHQYLYVVNGKIQDEDHDFMFTGFLDGAEDAEFVHSKGRKWMVYRAGHFDIAAPYIKGAGLFVRDNRQRSNDWVKLCSY